MAIYETSVRSSFVLKMASLLLLGTKHGSGSNNNSIRCGNSDRSEWPASATVGIGLFVLLYLTGKYASSDSNTDDDESSDEHGNSSVYSKQKKTSGAATAVYTFCRIMVNTFLDSLPSKSLRREDDNALLRARLRALEKAQNTKGRSRRNAYDDATTLSCHEGSCQCNAVKYRIRAPRKLQIVEDQKLDLVSIQYPHVKIPVGNFDLVAGTSHMQSFQTSAECDDSNKPKLVAHTFCSRCGVHLLHATKSSNYLFINALTLKKDSPVEMSDIDLYSNARRLRKSYQEFDAEIETKTTAHSTSSDELDPPFAESSRPPSPISIHSSQLDENILRNQINITNISCSLKDHNDVHYEDDFDTRSIKSALFHQGLPSTNKKATMYRSPLDDDDADCFSLKSAPCRPPNGTIIGFRRRSLSNRMHYGANASLAEMDAQSVASSISDNLYSTSHVLDSASVYSRSSSLRSVRSSEHSHFQLRKYLTKHVTPKHSYSSPASGFEEHVSSPASGVGEDVSSPATSSGFGEDVAEQSHLIDRPKLSATLSDDADSPAIPETLIDDMSQPELNQDNSFDEYSD